MLLKHKYSEAALNLKKTLSAAKEAAAENQEWIIEKVNELAKKPSHKL